MQIPLFVGEKLTKMSSLQYLKKGKAFGIYKIFILVILSLTVVVSLMQTLSMASALTEDQLSDSTPNKYIVILVDDSYSMWTEHDESGLRFRFAHFLVNYLTEFDPIAQVGVITFAANTRSVVPLQPVKEWRSGDFHMLATSEGVGGSRFDDALQKSLDDLGSVDCENNECYVFLFTDGKFANSDTTLEDVGTILSNVNHIDIVPVLFDLDAETEEIWGEGFGLLPLADEGDVIIDVVGEEKKIVYDSLLSRLKVDVAETFCTLVLSEETTVLTIPNESCIHVEDIPAYLRFFSVNLFSDREIQDTWSPIPYNNSSDSSLRFWLDPPTRVFTAVLQTDNSVGETIVYYQIDDSQELHVRLSATKIAPQPVGELFILEAYFDIEGVGIIKDSENHSITADIVSDSGVVDSYNLQWSDGGVFTTNVLITKPASYTIVYSPTTALDLLQVASVAQMIVVGHVPTIELLESVLLTDTGELLVTAVISHYEVLQDIQRPYLTSENISQQLLDCQDDGVCTTVISGDEFISFQLVLPAGNTKQGVFYTELSDSSSYRPLLSIPTVTPPSTTTQREPEEVLRPQGRAVLIIAIVVIVIVIVIVIVALIIRSVYSQKSIQTSQKELKESLEAETIDISAIKHALRNLDKRHGELNIDSNWSYIAQLATFPPSEFHNVVAPLIEEQNLFAIAAKLHRTLMEATKEASLPTLSILYCDVFTYNNEVSNVILLQDQEQGVLGFRVSPKFMIALKKTIEKFKIANDTDLDAVKQVWESMQTFFGSASNEGAIARLKTLHADIEGVESNGISSYLGRMTEILNELNEGKLTKEYIKQKNFEHIGFHKNYTDAVCISPIWGRGESSRVSSVESVQCETLRILVEHEIEDIFNNEIIRKQLEDLIKKWPIPEQLVLRTVLNNKLEEEGNA